MEPDLASQDSDRSVSPIGGTPLNGTLEDNTPAGVLQMLSSQGETGAVRFSGQSNCTVYLHDGELYFAEDTDTGEDLAVALVRPGRLTADQWDQSTAEGYPTDQVGEAILATGAIDRELLASVVLSVIYDPLIQLFRAPEGDFEFEPGVVHWIGPFRSFGVDAIVAEVRRRTREADEMAPLIPTLDAWVQTARTLPPEHGNVSLRRDDWEVVISAATGSTVNDLAVELGRGRWSTARLVYRLASVNLVEVSEAAPAVESTPEPFEGDTFGGSDTTFSFDSGTVTDDAPSMGDGPPPLDLADFGAPAETGTSDDSWSAGNSWEPAGWDTPTPEVTSPEAESPSAWDTPAEETTSWSTSEDTGTWGTTTDDLGGSDTESDMLGDDPLASTVSEPDRDLADTAFGFADATTAADDTHGIEFEAPALHPDIAKALAESTYADSATAINAMAARLGALADDDDDFDDDEDVTSATGEDPSDFWSSDNGDKAFPWEESSGGDDSAGGFTWQPAAWDAGVEATPLPQREHVAAAAPAEAGQQGGDPQWLENLYTQFMPGAGGKGAASPEASDPNFGADPGAAPKAKTLKRLMSAIRRL